RRQDPTFLHARASWGGPGDPPASAPSQAVQRLSLAGAHVCALGRLLLALHLSWPSGDLGVQIAQQRQNDGGTIPEENLRATVSPAEKNLSLTTVPRPSAPKPLLSDASVLSSTVPAAAQLLPLAVGPRPGSWCSAPSSLGPRGTGPSCAGTSRKMHRNPYAKGFQKPTARTGLRRPPQVGPCASGVWGVGRISCTGGGRAGNRACAPVGQHNYLCAGRNDCIVDKIRRKNCPACRLRKCCQAGMVLGGRKFKKFNKVRVMRALDAVALPQPVGVPAESQALSQRLSFSPSQDIQLVPPLISLLMSIEPDVVYAGHDNSKPDTSSSLLTSLNQLGERQLLSVVKWSKSLPGFRNLHIDDQITLIQYSWMSLMVFGLGWRSYRHVSGQMLYFAPDLILNEQRMKESSFYSLCLTMWQIPQEFVKLQVSQEEYLCMKVLLLLNTIPLEGLRSQSQFEEMRSSYIRELIKAIGLRQKGVVSSSQRFYQLTKLLDSLHDLVKQLHLYCLNTFIQSRSLSVEFPEMMSEVIAAQLPKILAGMVKPLLFHKK
ncbi:Progesterone receptor, partial [Galemys pyrenaicus]